MSTSMYYRDAGKRKLKKEQKCYQLIILKEMCMYACMLVCTHNLRTFLSLKIYAHIMQLYIRIF